MQPVLLTALGVGGATVFGALIGFIFKKFSHTFSDIVLSFAAGVMLSAAVIGLIIPSLEYGGELAILITVVGIFAGALFTAYFQSRSGRLWEQLFCNDVGCCGTCAPCGGIVFASVLFRQDEPFLCRATCVDCGVGSSYYRICVLL